MRASTLIFVDAVMLAFCSIMLVGAPEARWLYAGLTLMTLAELVRDVRDFDEGR